MKRKASSEDAETPWGRAADKRRRLYPMLWRRDEVSSFLASRSGLSQSQAGKAQDALALSGNELRTAVDAGTWSLDAVPETKREAVHAAANELLDPLFPKVFPKKLVSTLLPTHAHFYRQFLLYDTNGNGTIDTDEFRHLVKSTTGLNPSPDEFRQLMRAADMNDDGGITFGEFKHFCNTNDAAVAKSLREVVLENLLAAEEAAVNASAQFFETVPCPALLGVVEIGRSASAVKRLTLTRRARLCSTLSSLVLLALAAVVAFVPLLKLSDIAVPDAIDIEMLVQEVQRLHGKGHDEHAKCKSFIKSNCPQWKPGNGWTRSDYRRCSIVLHPDKGGSNSKFRQLSDCNTSLENLREQHYLVMLALYVIFMTNLVVVAACSSTSAALLFVAQTLCDQTAASASAATLPDLETSFRLFVVLCGCVLAIGTYQLAKFRGQSWLGGWLAGARVCRVTDGLPAGTLRVLVLDAVQGLTDVSLVLFAIACLHHMECQSVEEMLRASPAMLTIGACWLQHVIASRNAVHFGGRGLAEFATGTVLLCLKAGKDD